MKYKIGDKIKVRYHVINLFDGGQARVFEDARQAPLRYPETVICLETQEEVDGYGKFGKFSRRIC